MTGCGLNFWVYGATTQMKAFEEWGGGGGAKVGHGVHLWSWCDFNILKRGEFADRHGEQGWRSDESTCLPPVWPWVRFPVSRYMWVIKFVAGSLPCSERGLSVYLRFSSLLKNLNFPAMKFESDLDSVPNSTVCDLFCFIIFFKFVYIFHPKGLSPREPEV